MNEFDLQFKIFTLVDTTKSYVILNESMNKLLSVSESIVLMRYAFYEISFQRSNRQTCLYMLRDRIRQKLQKKQTFRDQVTGQNFSTVINEKSRFNGYFNSDFDDFLQLHSLTLYEYNE